MQNFNKDVEHAYLEPDHFHLELVRYAASVVEHCEALLAELPEYLQLQHLLQERLHRRRPRLNELLLVELDLSSLEYDTRNESVLRSINLKSHCSCSLYFKWR